MITEDLTLDALMGETAPAISSNESVEEVEDLLAYQRHDPDTPVPTVFLTGSAGTGKTHTAKQLMKRNPRFGILAATTGIAGVNMDTTTIHALLKYFNTESLQESYRRGRLNAVFFAIAKQHDNVLIDEISMADKVQLDIWINSIREVNEYSEMRARNRKLGLILTGDFCQLPPVKADWAFHAESWPLFAANTVRLTKSWRQGDEEFIRALQFLRAGEGEEATKILKPRVHWLTSIDMKMKDVTTITPVNKVADRQNLMMLNQLKGSVIYIASRKRGKLVGGWNHIPEQLAIKDGAWVMLLANAEVEREGLFDFTTELPYANGSCGWVRDIDIPNKCVWVELAKNKTLHPIKLLTRYNYTKDKPDEMMEDGYRPWWEPKMKKWVIGEVTYMPMRLAYASTIHKTQGLTLDRIQVDTTNHFFASPAMAYVSLSRAKRIEDVYIVGSPERFPKKVVIDELVRPWL